MSGRDTENHLTHFFPKPVELAALDWTAVGMPRKRKETLQRLSQKAASGNWQLDLAKGLPDLINCLTKIPGIGNWTANYIAMRALAQPDAFPASDLGILKALQQGTRRPTPAQAAERAEKWRPWRAYAAIYLWHALEAK